MGGDRLSRPKYAHPEEFGLPRDNPTRARDGPCLLRSPLLESGCSKQRPHGMDDSHRRFRHGRCRTDLCRHREYQFIRNFDLRQWPGTPPYTSSQCQTLVASDSLVPGAVPPLCFLAHRALRHGKQFPGLQRHPFRAGCRFALRRLCLCSSSTAQSGGDF